MKDMTKKELQDTVANMCQKNAALETELSEAKDKIDRLRYELHELSKVDDEQRAMLHQLREELKVYRNQAEASYQYEYNQTLTMKNALLQMQLDAIKAIIGRGK